MPVILLIVAISVFPACSSERSPDSETQADTSAEISIESVIENCGTLLYAALYFLPELTQEFTWPSAVAGIQPHLFHDELSNTQKEEIRSDFISLFNKISQAGDRQAIRNNLDNWCGIYSSFLKQDDLSIEEFFAMVYESGEFGELFEPFMNRPLFRADDLDAIDKIAGLSSAELHDLSGRFTTSLALRSPDIRNYYIQEFRLGH
jgi:hypothetical protein